MEQEPHKAPLRYHEIDLMRFVAALSVVIYHYTFVGFHFNKQSPIQYEEIEGITQYGYMGVELFFIISGYVVLMSAYKKSVRQFFLSRVTRLYPAFWVSCTLTFLVVSWDYAHSGGAGLLHQLKVGTKLYAYNMTMLEEFFSYFPLDGSYWTLSYEIVFYFLISVLIGYGLMKRLDLFLALWLLCSALVGPGPGMKGGFFRLFITDYSPFFAAGMVFYLLQRKLFTPWKLYALLVASYMLSLRCVRATASTYSKLFQVPFSFPIVAAVITVMFVLFALVAYRKINLQYNWLSYLGALTYPLYLLHATIGFVLFRNLAGHTNKYLLLAAVILLMLALAYAIHVLIEKQFSKTLGYQVNKLLDCTTPQKLDSLAGHVK
ncbi:acyltransferase family protein [Hymenobacter siberiensis]|uniref:acyltransferase family protein n=1 Tax=Hymenobacter siberiensis TaxID=2848396 RepID=UPI001C1E67C0|nr:acyltransferase [Hymenobacter siberiensis]MBU6119527.1 acyltransferase [Hymenobacter siberiensis]